VAAHLRGRGDEVVAVAHELHPVLTLSVLPEGGLDVLLLVVEEVAGPVLQALLGLGAEVFLVRAVDGAADGAGEQGVGDVGGGVGDPAGSQAEDLGPLVGGQVRCAVQVVGDAPVSEGAAQSEGMGRGPGMGLVTGRRHAPWRTETRTHSLH
jgi:hypothetical protein